MHVPLPPSPPPRDVRVLKSSEQYLIVACDEASGRRVIKIAHRDPEKLHREIERIEALTAAIPTLRHRLPPVLQSGVIADGVHTGKAYYAEPHFPGNTFSQWVQNRFADRVELRSTFDVLVRELLDIAADHQCDRAYDAQSGQFLRSCIRQEYDRLASLALIAPFLERDELIVDGVPYASLRSMLEQFDARAVYAAADAGPSTIATLGHWNFHGDNIILSTLAATSAFKVIDPDVSIETHDPLFGVARFLYTFPHDTADYGQYLLHTDAFDPLGSGGTSFRVTYLWPEMVFRNYAELFGSVLASGATHLGAIDSRLDEPRTAIRLQLCVLACLLRGVRANYEETLEFVEGRVTTFRHKGILLFLEAVRFANHLATSIPIATASAVESVRVVA